MLKSFIGRKKLMEFNKDTTIGEILEKAPEKADILLEIGMHCLGCPASQMETLEEACGVHGIDVNEVLTKINA
jgi:hydroxylamine reductase